MTKRAAEDTARDGAVERDLARTRNSYERTMMSWIRTATSLITFGFSVYKFFQLEASRRVTESHLIGPRQFSFMLVSIGMISLVLATLEYRRNIRTLALESPGVGTHSLAVVVAALISVLGMLALLAMIFRQ
jgi:putative membrane protein